MTKNLMPIYSAKVMKYLISKGYLIQDVRDNNKFKNYKVYMFLDTKEIRDIVNNFKLINP